MADLLEKMAPVRGAAASYVSLFPKVGREGNPTHAVVILVNDFFCKRDEVRNSISRFLESQFKNDDN